MDNTLKFYHLSYHPFPGTGKPAETYESTDLRQAVAVAEVTAKENGVGLLTGPVGVGISYSAFCASGKLNQTQYTIRYYPVCDITPRDFYKGLCRVTDTNCQGKGKEAMIAAIRSHARMLKEQGRPLFLTLDNAQNIPSSVLQDIPTLVMEDYGIAPMMGILLCGTEELRDRIRSLHCESLLQLVSNRYTFRGLSEQECVAYVLHKLKLAGGTEALLTEDALNALHAASCLGNCRMLNNLMRKAFQIGAQAKRTTIDMDVLHSAAKHLVF